MPRSIQAVPSFTDWKRSPFLLIPRKENPPMKSSNSVKKILAALAIVACASFAQAGADSAKAVDTAIAPKAAKAAKHKKMAKESVPAPAQAKVADSAKASGPAKAAAIKGAKGCDELKEKIAAKMEAKGVKGAVLTVTPKDEAGKSGKIVGSCEGGSKKIVYTRS